MKATCRSWYVCPRGAAVYLMITPDMVSSAPLKNWTCPEHDKCKDCPHAHTPTDKRKKRTCDFAYAFTDRLIEAWMSGEQFQTLLNGCTDVAREILMRLAHNHAKEGNWQDWLDERRSVYEKEAAE